MKKAMKRLLLLVLCAILASFSPAGSLATTTVYAAAPKVTRDITYNKTKKSTKKTTMSKAAKSTKTVDKGTTTKTTEGKVTFSGDLTTVQKIKTVTVHTYIEYTKGSKKKKTVTETTTVITKVTSVYGSFSDLPSDLAMKKLAPKVQDYIPEAFKKAGFKIIINPNYSTMACSFNESGRNITLLSATGTNIYHAIGHFISYMAGDVQNSAAFKAIFNEEIGSFAGAYPSNARLAPKEFFGECTREYYTNKSSLKAHCPKAYATLVNAIKKVKASVS